MAADYLQGVLLWQGKMLEINALILITSHVDACQNDFFEAVSDNISYIFINLVSRTTCRSATHIRDDAIRAEIVASVVNLDQTAGVESGVSWTVAEQILVEAFRVDVFAFYAAVDDAEKRIFSLVVNGVVDDTTVEHLLFSVIHHAAHRGNDGVRVGAPDLVDCLPTFLVALVGHGAGVHDVNVSICVVFHHVVTRLLELRR